MTKIFKFPFKIASKFEIEMPQAAKICKVAYQDGVACLWAIVDTDAKPLKRRFVTIATGEAITNGWYDCAVFLETLHSPEGYVWHVFEVKDSM